MALIKCPECGREISDTSRICIHCGYPLEEELNKNVADIKCPECGTEISDNTNVCTQCGYEIIKQNKLASDDKKEAIVYKNRKYISILMCLIGCILLAVSITRITSDEYKFYKQHYQDCMDGYADTKSIANSYSSGYFRDSYNYIASNYEDMAIEDRKRIWKFRIQAIGLLCGGCGLIICGYKIYKKKINENRVIKRHECGKENVFYTDKIHLDCKDGIKEHFGKIGAGEEKVQENVEIKEENIKSEVFVEKEIYKNEPVANISSRKTLYSVCAVLAIVFTIVIITVAVSENVKKCTFSGCDNYKIEGSEYCKEHTCRAVGCTNSKSKYDTYCYTHEQELCCFVEDCTNDKMEGGEYCYFHTCERPGCYEKKISDTDYCFDHQVDMSKRLTESSFYFVLNSAGGIDFNFSAKNSTGKEIKYVKFDVELRNAVGDLVEDEIKNTTSVSVEIVGPVKSGGEVNMIHEIIGYCDTCARIDINSITIIYTDGTSETGHYGYYFERN